MDLSDYRVKSVGEFELILDRWILSNKMIVPKEGNYSKEDHFKEILVDVFKMGLKAGQLPCNVPIDLKKMCNA